MTDAYIRFSHTFGGAKPKKDMSHVTIASVPRISREKLSTLVRAKSPSLAIIDVRDSDFIGGHIIGCTNVPTNTHDYKMPELVRTLKDKETVVFHCALSQQRGPSSALRYLRERERLVGGEVEKKDDGAGEAPEVKEQTVYILEGGFVKWQELYVWSDVVSCWPSAYNLSATEKTRILLKATKRTSGNLATRSQATASYTTGLGPANHIWLHPRHLSGRAGHATSMIPAVFKSPTMPVLDRNLPIY